MPSGTPPCSRGVVPSPTRSHFADVTFHDPDGNTWLVQEKNIQLVLFDDDLTPVQVRNLEKLIQCKIVDRSGLILEAVP